MSLSFLFLDVCPRPRSTEGYPLGNGEVRFDSIPPVRLDAPETTPPPSDQKPFLGVW